MNDISSERRSLLVQLRWLNAGGGLPRSDHSDQYIERQSIRSNRPPKCKFQLVERAVQTFGSRRDRIASNNELGRSIKSP